MKVKVLTQAKDGVNQKDKSRLHLKCGIISLFAKAYIQGFKKGFTHDFKKIATIKQEYQ